MSTRTLADLLTRCGCCKGIGDNPIGSIENPYGLPLLRYRAGTHASFKAAMLTAIAPQPGLSSLGTRSDDDLTIATIDAWAAVLDVLTFYQERIANEVFLRTSQERLSLLELARLIGYELRPGVAANVLLAFTLDKSDTSPVDVTIPATLRTQNIPTDDSPPQSFETSEEFLARPHWNLLRSRQTGEHALTAENGEGSPENLGTYYVKGVGASLRVGDRLLLVTGEAGDTQKLLQVRGVETEPDLDRTRVEVGGSVAPVASVSEPGRLLDLHKEQFVGSLANGLINTGGVSQAVSASDASVWYSLTGATYTQLASSIVYQIGQVVTTPGPNDPGLYVLRRSAAAFGHNAPKHATILEDWRVTEDADLTPPYANNWDANPPSVREDSHGKLRRDPQGDTVILDQVYGDIVPGGWVVFVSGASVEPFRVASVGEQSVADFAISGKATVVQVEEADGGSAPSALDGFTFRDTAIYSASQLLELADLPIERLEKGTAEFDLEEVITDLLPGHKLVLVGTRLDEWEGVSGAEELELADVLIGERTRLVLKQPLQYSYDNATVKVYANVVGATHGETREEALGSGEASQPMQRFKLSKSPLTHVPAETASGAESTLELKVGGVTWDEASSLYALGPKDRNYILRRDDAGNSFVIFGDGRRGSRVPTGPENVSARYRWGIGSDGMVEAGSISLLPVKPLGVKQVTNPLASAGGEDPEQRDDARQNAPLTVLTLDRIVSLKDFEDFARTFAGIGKARAEWVWDGRCRLAHVTVAGPDGTELSSTNIENLLDAIDAYGRPHVPRAVTAYEPLFFKLTAGIGVDPDYITDSVKAKVVAVIEERFSFEARRFAQRVAKSDVLAVIQGVPGIEWVDLDAMDYFTVDGGNTPDEFGLPAQGARFDSETEKLKAAQLLTLSPAGIVVEPR